MWNFAKLSHRSKFAITIFFFFERTICQFLFWPKLPGFYLRLEHGAKKKGGSFIFSTFILWNRQIWLDLLMVDYNSRHLKNNLCTQCVEFNIASEFFFSWLSQMFSSLVNFHVLAKKQKKLEIFCCLFFSWLSQMFSFVANFQVLTKKQRKMEIFCCLFPWFFGGKVHFSMKFLSNICHI